MSNKEGKKEVFDLTPVSVERMTVKLALAKAAQKAGRASLEVVDDRVSEHIILNPELYKKILSLEKINILPGRISESTVEGVRFSLRDDKFIPCSVKLNAVWNPDEYQIVRIGGRKVLQIRRETK